MTWTPAAVKQLRSRLGLTQAALAAELGCALSAVTMWEQGHRTPRGLYAAALDRLAERDNAMRTDMTAKHVAAVIRVGGFRRIVAGIGGGPQVMIEEGWDLTNWTYQQAAGAILFVRYDAPPPIDEPRLTLTRERDALTAEMRRLLAASHHDPDAHARREAAWTRAKAIDWALRDLPAVDDPRVAVEGVLCVNDDDAATWEAIAAESAYPLVVLTRRDWLPQSGLPVQPGEVPF